MKRFLLLSLFLAIVSCEQSPEGNPEEIESKKMKVSVITEAASEINPTSAKLTATVSVTNPAEDAEAIAYFYYSAEDKEVKAVKQNGTRIPVGTITMEDSSFETTIVNLSPSTQYYYFAEVAIDDLVFDGQINSFTTAEKPKELSVTGTAYDITEFTAKLSGYANLTPDLGEVTMGILYSLDENPTLDNSIELISREIDGNNMYVVQATELNYNTTYYYKSFVKYGGVYRSGEVKSFSTRDFVASATTEEASNITEFRATFNGQLSVISLDQLSTNVWFLFSETTNNIESLMLEGKRLDATLNTDGTFSTSSYLYSKLKYNTQYYFVACAQVHDKTVFGIVRSFTTLDITAVVSAEPASNVTELKATLNGRLELDCKEPLEPYVWFLWSDKQNDIDGMLREGTRAMCSINNGSTFQADISSLTPGQKYYYVACAYVYDKVLYSEVNSFNANSINAISTTNEATDITEISANISGILEINSEECFQQRSWFICSNIASNLEDLKANGRVISPMQNSEGSFSALLTNLKSNTEYYYVACSEVHDRVFYGEVKSFRTKTIQASFAPVELKSITEFKVMLSGQLNVFSTIDLDKTVSIYYSTTACSLSELLATGTMVSVSLDNNGSFIRTLEKLPYGTKHYYVIVASVYDEIFYDEVRSFSTLDINASVITGDARDITEYKASINGSLLVDSIEPLQKSVWLLYSKTASSLESLQSTGNKVALVLDNYDSFTGDLSGLEYNTKYYYVACAKVHDKEYHGEIKSFNTKDFSVEIDTYDASNISEFKASLNGKITIYSQETLNYSIWLLYSNEYSTKGDLLSYGTKANSILNSEGSFNCDLTNLKYNTDYYYVVCANVAGREYHGEIKSFKTRDFQVEVTSTGVTNITEYKATLNGRLIVNCQEQLDRSVWFLYCEGVSTLNNLLSTGTLKRTTINESGLFSVALADLEMGKSYSYVACTQVHDKTCYSDVKSFTTAEPIVTIDTRDAINVEYHTASLVSNVTVSCIEELSQEFYYLYSGQVSSLNGLEESGTIINCTLRSGELDASLNSLSDGTTYYYVACATVDGRRYYGDLKSFTTKAIPEGAVDLGIMFTREDGSRYELFWAECNLGASSPQQNGTLYSWGSSTSSVSYSWSYYNWGYTYKYGTGVEEKRLNKYNEDDGLEVIEAEDDAAHCLLGGNWRIPSITEWTTMLSMCTWSGGDNGLFTLTSKINGNSISIKAGGYKEGTTSVYPGVRGFYWSSSINTDNLLSAWSIYWYTGKPESRSMARHLGLYIRPVTE